MAHAMAKNDLIEMTVTKTLPEDASDHPITHRATSQQEPLPEWPNRPHPLKPPSKTEMLLDAFDISLIAITVALIVKAALCIVASHVDKQNHGYTIDQASMLSRYLIQFNRRLTTIFTIIFSLIITTLFRRIALHRAQEGSATIAELEQLQASSSLPGAIKAMWSLRSFTYISLYLVSCWFWYYLGSQATTYEYELVMSGPKKWFHVAYPSSDAQSVFNSSLGSNDVVISNVNAHFLANYAIASASSGADLSGAVLVPLYDTSSSTEYENGQNDVVTDQGGWWNVGEPSKVKYASSIGLPFQSPGLEVSTTGRIVGDVSLNTTFLNITCSAPVVKKAADFPNGTLADTTITINMTSLSTSNTTAVDDPPATFDIWLRANATSKTLSSSCDVRTVFLEMQVHCPGTFCAATKVRRTRGDHLPVNRSPFDNRDFGSTFFNELLISNGSPSSQLNGDTSSVSIIQSNILTGFKDYLDVLSGPAFLAEPPDPSEDLYESFQLVQWITPLINTYYQASLLPQLHANDNINDIITGQTPSTDWSIALFHGAEYDPQYHLSYPWIVIDILACAILLISAVRAFHIRKRTIAPDIFGYVSSLTRNNPDLDLPDGGSTLSGFERSRLMKHVRIKIADVSSDSEVGRVGLQKAGTGDGWGRQTSIETAQLKLNRHYL